MSIMKDLYMEESENIHAKAEELGITLSTSELGKRAMAAAKDRFADMCDEAKDKAKYEQ